jgi:hypothetical protein
MQKQNTFKTDKSVESDYPESEISDAHRRIGTEISLSKLGAN